MQKEEFTLEWVIEFIAERVAKLREAKNVSAHTMSMDLGQNRAYIHKIENKQAKPSIEGLVNICNYFDITFEDFFNTGIEEVDLYIELLEIAKELEREQLQVLIDVARQFQKDNKSAAPK